MTALLPQFFRILKLPGWIVNKFILGAKIKLGPLRSPIVVSCMGGLKVWILSTQDLIQRQLYFQGYFEYRETKLMGAILEPGMVVVDVGANIGWLSLVAARQVGKSGRVISFEPVQATYAHLQKNIELNQFRNVTALNFGLSSEAGDVPIYSVDESNAGAHTLFSHEISTPVLEWITVRRAIDVPELLQLERIDLCKIDVEGAELNVLDGFQSFLNDGKIARMMIELNENALNAAGRSGKELVARLSSAGFVLTDINSGRLIFPGSALPSQANLDCRLKNLQDCRTAVE